MAQANNWSLEELYLDVSVNFKPVAWWNIGYTSPTRHATVVTSACVPLCVQVLVDIKGQLDDCSFGVTGEELISPLIIIGLR